MSRSGATPAVLLSCALLLAGAAVVAAAEDLLLATELAADDECRGEQDTEHCSLNAIQLRSLRAKQGAEAEGGVKFDAAQTKAVSNHSVALGACEADPIAGFLSAVAPACVEACPQLCAAALPALAAFRASGDASAGACAGSAQLACALEARNAEACKPALEQVELLGISVPQTPTALSDICSKSATLAFRGESAEVSEAELRQGLIQRGSLEAGSGAQMLETVLSGKTKDPRCPKGYTGRTCVARSEWIYCQDTFRVSSGKASCEHSIGQKSYCRKGSEKGQTEDYCDNPFCRNGGAYEGDGKYCQQDHVVLCSGDSEPKIIRDCHDAVWTDDNGLEHVKMNHCIGAPPNPDCMH